MLCAHTPALCEEQKQIILNLVSFMSQQFSYDYFTQKSRIILNYMTEVL